MKTLILIVLCAVLTNSFSQEHTIKAGLSFSNIHVVDDNNVKKEGLKFLSGFELGVASKLIDLEMVSVWAGLSIASKGYQQESEEIYSGTQFKHNRIRLNTFYFEIPILGRFEYGVSDLSFYITLGPYSALGVYGRYKNDVLNSANSVIDTELKTIEWGKEEQSFNRFDFGGYFGIGASYFNTQFELSYLHGLSDIGNKKNFDYSNRSFRLTIGIKFKK